MIRIYNLPTHKQYKTTATVKRWQNNKLVEGEKLSNIVFYQKQFRLDNNQIGYEYKMFIDQDIIDEDMRDLQFVIDDRSYEVIDYKLSKNVDTYPFWLVELKQKNK